MLYLRGRKRSQRFPALWRWLWTGHPCPAGQLADGSVHHMCLCHEEMLQHNFSLNHLIRAIRITSWDWELSFMWRGTGISFSSWKEDKTVFWWENTLKSKSKRTVSLLIVNLLISLSECFPEHLAVCDVFALTTHYKGITGMETKHRDSVLLRSALTPISPAQIRPVLPLKSAISIDLQSNWGTGCWFGQCWSRIMNSTHHLKWWFKSHAPSRKLGA